MNQHLKALRWAVIQAKENLGAYIGSPYEQGYRQRLKDAQRALRCFRDVLVVFKEIPTGFHEDYDNGDGTEPHPCRCSQCCHRRDVLAILKRYSV